jgi:hypothetical protein
MARLLPIKRIGKPRLDPTIAIIGYVCSLPSSIKNNIWKK